MKDPFFLSAKIVRIGLPAACGFFFAVLVLSGPSFAKTGHPSRDFTTYSLEELMAIEITSAAKKPQPALKSASATYVITREDIRRSGAVNLPEALRMAPGIQVLRSDPGDFAVTSRGFLGKYANKLLVLVDGRSIYSPLFSGTFWAYNDVLLEDIERIEIIRGPGATLWGANAVNGVINIITKNAQDTQGGLAVATAGTTEGYDALRYGFKIQDGMYLRAYGKYMHFNGLVNRQSRGDPRQVSGGMRLDWDMTNRDKLLVTAGYYDHGEKGVTSRPVTLPRAVNITTHVDSSVKGGYALCRWAHTFSRTSTMQLQAYYNGITHRGERNTPDQPAQDSPLLRDDTDRIDTWDLDFQHTFALGGRNSIIWGLNARFTRAKKRDINIYFKLDSETEQLRHYSAFVQDELQLVPGLLSLSVGSKFEYTSYTQFGVQPSARLLYTPSDRHSFWLAVSRAVRTPSILEAHGAVNSGFIARGRLFPLSPAGIVQLQGNKDYGPEELIAYEAGYRFNLAADFSLDTALFYNVYHDLRTMEPAGLQLQRGHVLLPVRTDNKMHGRTYGAEMAATWQVLPQWRLLATYSYLRMNLTPEKDSKDTLSEYDEDLGSRHLFNLRSLYSITPSLEFDVGLYFADRIKRLNNPSHADLTVRLGWKPSEHVTLEAIGYNLIDNKYGGFRDEIYKHCNNKVRRAFYGRITLEF